MSTKLSLSQACKAPQSDGQKCNRPPLLSLNVIQQANKSKAHKVHEVGSSKPSAEAEAEAVADGARGALAALDDARSGRARRRLRDFYRESEPLDTPCIRAVREAIADRLSSSYLQREGEAACAGPASARP